MNSSFVTSLLEVLLFVEEALEPSSPELIVPSPPQQVVTEPEPMEIVAAPEDTDNSAEPQYMQRKLVSKTYVNEEGYMGS